MKKLNFTIFHLLILAIGPLSVCYAQNPKNAVVDTKVEYVVTQHDFNGDAMDEIVIASRLKDGYAVLVGICIYNIIDGQSWCLEAPATWFDMFVSLKGNRT